MNEPADCDKGVSDGLILKLVVGIGTYRTRDEGLVDRPTLLRLLRRRRLLLLILLDLG